MTTNNINHNQQSEISDYALIKKNEQLTPAAIPACMGQKIIDRTAPMQETTFESILQTIRTSSDLRQKVQTLRSIQDAEEQQTFKKKELPYFTIGEFRNNHLSNDNFKRTKYILLDYDHLGASLTSSKQLLIQDPYVQACFDSPRDGIKVNVELSEYVTSIEQYDVAYEHVGQYFFEKYNLVYDVGAKDAARACYLSYDPDAFFNRSNRVFEVKTLLTSLRPESPVKRAASKVSFQGVSKGDRNKASASILGKFIQQGWKKEDSYEMLRLWNNENNPPLSESELNNQVEYFYKKYADPLKRLPMKFKAKENCYVRIIVKKKDEYEERTVTTFIIEPKELLELEDNDCLRCDVISYQGQEYRDILIENADWHSKAKLLKAIGHQDCSFVGSDQEIQALCAFVNTFVPVRKKGTKVIGLHTDIWVTKESNITSQSIENDLVIIPYDKGSDAFINKIAYNKLDENEYSEMAKELYSNILAINDHKVIAPILGWAFATPVKPKIMEHNGSFPLLFIHGSQGDGKTSTAELILRLHGYKDAEPNKCSMKPFPMLKMLSSTNAIPVMLDEFKVSDLKADTVNHILRTMRESYTGQLESKGRADQTTQEYKLDAPLAIIGEWSIQQPAIKERIIFARFSKTVKENADMQAAYKTVRQLPLEGFMPRYISFCLRQNIGDLYDSAYEIVKNCFKEITVAPRIVHNMSVMVLGLTLFRMYGEYLGVEVPEINLEEILKAQLEEITGNKSGFVRSAVDQLISELSVFAQKNGGLTFGEGWYKPCEIEGKFALAIRYNMIFPAFKEHAYRTHYEGDLLDKESYLKLFDECDYVIEKDRNVKFGSKQYRSLCIDIDKAKASGIDLEGFGV
ncbi:BT4734/BF3469 family protein [Zoogloea sp.]|uniref:BT4734/BF3469 family protein n=1 Tax=Zoogloea sp. TaxID=49181 RepID=UPI0031FCEFBF